jgi:RHS repeat-associated protein
MGLDVSIYDLSLRAVRTDFFIPGCIVPMQATFIYEQVRRFDDSPYGYGWRFIYGAYYRELSDGSLLIGPIEGQTIRENLGSGRLSQPGPGRYEYRASRETTYYFDDPGHKQVTRISDGRGGYLLFNYDPAGRLVRMTDHYGRHLDFSYSNGRLATLTDANITPVRTTRYTYDGAGNLASVTDPLGNVTRYTTDNNHSLTKVTDSLGNWVALQYNDSSVARLSTLLNSVEFVRVQGWRFVSGLQEIYENHTIVTDVVNGQQRSTRYEFDWGGRIYSITDPEGNVTTMRRDPQGNITQLTDGNGNITKYAYDHAQRLIQVTEPLSRTTTYAYYGGSELVSSTTDPLGRTVRYNYDSHNNVVSHTDPISNTTRFSYDNRGKLLSATDPMSNTVSINYDAFGFPLTLNEGGITTTYNYNARGELLSLVDGGGRQTTYGYDTLGRTITITNAAGETTRLNYDSNGNMSQLFDAAGRVVNYAYDAEGNPVKMADALGAIFYSFDPSGNIEAITDGEGNRSAFTYDLNGRMTSRTDVLGQTTSFSYDGAGNLIRRTDPQNQITTYTYDAADQLTSIVYPGSSSVNYSYDAAGNLLQETNGVVTVDYTYDALDRITGVTAAAKTISYTYDAAGRRATMTDPDGNVTSYSYDSAGRLLSVSDPFAGVVGYLYGVTGKLSQLDRSNGVYSTYGYDAVDRLQSVTHHAPGGAVLDGYTYTYDAAGNRTSVTDNNGDVTSFNYDGRYQLTGVNYPDGTSTDYSYDLAGNRLSEGGASYAYDAADQLLSAGITTYGWDARGNQVQETTSGLSSIYGYDHENRLVSGSYADGTGVSYSYYPDGRVYSRTDRAGQITHFYYDGPNLLLETDSGGSTVARYTNGLHLDSWLAMERGGQNYGYLHDGLNSITGLTDGSGALAASYQYDAYGSIRSQTGGVPNPFRFTGRYWDDDASLYQYRARWYDPSTGRFLSRDPLGPIHVRQMYAYVRNNPASNVDPLGLDDWKCDTGKFSIAFIIGYERTNLRCTNQRTGETCSLKQSCFKAGVVAGGGIGGCGGWIFNGPSRGRDLAGGGFSVTAGIGGGVGVGGEAGASISTENSGRELNLCGGVGSFGLEISLGGQYCSTTILSCTRRPEPPPPPARPPRQPGRDHADDNYSAASRILPLSNVQYPLIGAQTQGQLTPVQDPPVLVGESRVGIFWHGYAEEAQALLSSWGWSTEQVDINFVPTSLELPVLFIPSGGVFGLEGVPGIRARLEAYTTQGGMIIALAQQHGYEFSSLPGGQLGGYGWSEDNSCFDASLYLSQYHPALTGFDEGTLTAGVDGFFGELPSGAMSLLHRTKNGQPSLILYPYADGSVVATSLYADWGASNFQPPEDSERLLRDLLSWAVDVDGPLPEFSPAMTATVSITVVNGTALDATSIQFVTLDPDGEVYAEEVVDVGVNSAASVQHSLQLTTLPHRLGIWWIQYTLLDGNGNVVQPAAWGGRLAVSSPAPAVGPGKSMGLSVTAPTEDFTPGPATFTFHVFNFTNQARSATVSYGFPHHTWETGDPGYGNFSNLGRGVNVPPQSEITFTHTADILTNDRLFAYLNDGGVQHQAWFQIRKAGPTVGASVALDEVEILRGQAGGVTVSLDNLLSTAYTVTLDISSQDTWNNPIHHEQRTVFLPSLTEVAPHLTFTIPISAQTGSATVIAQVLTAGGSLINSQVGRFLIPDSPLHFATDLPETYLPGVGTNLTVTATNGIFHRTVSSGTLAITLTSPSGANLSLTPQPFTVPAGQSQPVTVPFTPPAAEFGVYLFDFYVTDEFGEHAWREAVLNEPNVLMRLGRPSYAEGDRVSVDVVVRNSGPWSLNPALQLEMPAAGYNSSNVIAVAPGGQVTTTHVMTLSTSLAAGSYPVTATLTQGSAISDTIWATVPDSELHTSLADQSLTAGGLITVMVANSGGVRTTAGYSASLEDADRLVLATASGALASIPAGGNSSFTFTVPSTAASGDYLVNVVLSNTQASLVQPFTMLTDVSGVDVSLVAATEQRTYAQGQPITASATLSNDSAQTISGGALDLVVEGGDAWRWIYHKQGQHGPAPTIRQLAVDSSGIIWLDTHEALSAFDDGGTPFDLSDDRWQLYETSDGLQGRYGRTIFVDNNDYKWIYHAFPANYLNILDDGATPFDKSDDRWLAYEPADGLTGVPEVLAQDAAGNIWMATTNGAIVLDPGPNLFDKADDNWFTFNSSNSGLNHNSLSDMAIDGDGHKWFTTSNGVSVLDDGGDPFDAAGHNWRTFFFGTGLPQNEIDTMDIDGNGYKWFGGGYFGYNGGVSVLDTGASPFDGTGDRWLLFNTSEPALEDYRIKSLVTPASGGLWVATDSERIALLDWGADPFDGAGDIWHVYYAPNSQPYVDYVARGGGNKLWFGSTDLFLLDHGGTLLNEGDDQWQTYSANAGIGMAYVSLIEPGPGGLTWFGPRSNDQAGLHVLDDRGTPADILDDQWASFRRTDGLASDYVYDVDFDQSGVVWIGACCQTIALDHGGTPFDKSDDLLQSYGHAEIGIEFARDVSVDPANQKWFAGTGRFSTPMLAVLDDGGTPLSKGDDITMTYTTADGLRGAPSFLAIDQNGIKWMGGFSNGGVQALDDNGTPFDKSDDSWETFFSFQGLVDDDIYDIAVDEADRIWFVSNHWPAGGVSVLDYNGTLSNRADDRWRTFRQADGLGAPGAMELGIDAQGLPWFALGIGLSRLDYGADPFDGTGDEWRVFTTTHGLDSNAYWQVVGQGGDGNIWAGSANSGAAVGLRQPDILWRTSHAIDLPALQLSQTMTSVTGVSDPGRYQLAGDFRNSAGQRLASHRSSFFIFSGDTGLTLDASPDPVRAGAAFTVTGALVNNSAGALIDQDLLLTQDGAPLYSAGPFDVLPGSSYPFTITTTAPSSGNGSVLLASSGSLSMTHTVAIGRPLIQATAIVPPVVGSDPFSLTLNLKNSSIVPGQVQVDMDGAVKIVTVAAGQTALLQGSVQVCPGDDLTIPLSGDISQLLQVPVFHGTAATATFTPATLYAPGSIEIPFVISNTGHLDLPYTGLLTVTSVMSPSLTSNQQIVGQVSAGGTTTGRALFDLTAGQHLFSYEIKTGSCSLISGQLNLDVAPQTNVGISARAGEAGPTLPVTITLANQGSAGFEGALRLATDDGFEVSRRVSVTVNATQVVTMGVDVGLATSGVHTATITAVTGSGLSINQALINYSVHGPDLRLSSVPTITLLPLSQTVTLPFSVANAGDQGGQAKLRFTLGDLADETIVSHIPAGAEEAFNFTFFVPPEMEAREYLALYDLNDQQGTLALTIQGISLTIEAGTSLPAFREGEPASLRLTVTNQLNTVAPDLYALVSLDGVTQTIPFTLTTTPALLSFPLTATFGSGGVVFYGIYHRPSERGIHLNTLRLAQRQGAVTVLLDRDRYNPSDQVRATVLTSITGRLDYSAPGAAGSLSLAGANTVFSFTLPSPMTRGSYGLNYRLSDCNCEDEGRQYQAVFDVTGVSIRVSAVWLDEDGYLPGDQVNALLTIASDQEVDLLLRSNLIYPDGRSGAISERPIQLSNSPGNMISGSAIISGTEAGLHLFNYELRDVGDPSVIYADGAEAFALGSVDLLGMETEQASYLNITETVTVTVQLYASQPVTGLLSLSLDGGDSQLETIQLDSGLQTVAVRLNAPLTAGQRVVTATFSSNALSSQTQTSFAYGVALPDLRPAVPWLEPGDAPTRTLTAILVNDGGGTSLPTTARFYEGDPAQGGVLFGSAPVPSLAVGEQAMLSTTWNSIGKGGANVLVVSIDPVGEFDEENNVAQADLILPRLATQLFVIPGLVEAGDNATVEVLLENLQAAATLPVTTTVAIHSPTGETIYETDISVTLAGGESRRSDVVWQSAPGAMPGVYLVTEESRDLYGQRTVNGTFFTIAEPPSGYDIFLPMILR